MKEVDLLRQVVRRRFERAQCRKVLAQTGRHDLMDLLRIRQVAQAHGTQVAQRDAWRQAIADQLDDGPRQQDLAPVGRGHDARGAVHRRRRTSRCRGARRCRHEGRSAREARRPSVGFGPPVSANCSASAASRASTGSPKTANMPSPVVFTTVPRWDSTAARASASCRASARAMRSRFALPEPRAALDVREQDGDDCRRIDRTHIAIIASIGWAGRRRSRAPRGRHAISRVSPAVETARSAPACARRDRGVTGPSADAR